MFRRELFSTLYCLRAACFGEGGIRSGQPGRSPGGGESGRVDFPGCLCCMGRRKKRSAGLRSWVDRCFVRTGLPVDPKGGFRRAGCFLCCGYIRGFCSRWLPPPGKGSCLVRSVPGRVHDPGVGHSGLRLLEGRGLARAGCIRPASGCAEQVASIARFSVRAVERFPACCGPVPEVFPGSFRPRGKRRGCRTNDTLLSVCRPPAGCGKPATPAAFSCRAVILRRTDRKFRAGRNRASIAAPVPARIASKVPSGRRTARFPVARRGGCGRRIPASGSAGWFCL